MLSIRPITTTNNIQRNIQQKTTIIGTTKNMVIVLNSQIFIIPFCARSGLCVSHALFFQSACSVV